MVPVCKYRSIPRFYRTLHPQILAMPKTLLLCIGWLCGWAHLSVAQSDTSDTSPDQWPYRLGEQHLIKVAPTIYEGRPAGAVVQYETGLGLPHFSLLASVRYMSEQIPDEVGDIAIPAHWRLELQPRFYPIQVFQPIYMGPLFNITSEGTGAVGAILGWQGLPWGRLPIDLGIAMQTRNATENYDSPLFLRIHLGIGLAFPKLQPDNDE